jgi:hypothetical protein
LAIERIETRYWPAPALTHIVYPDKSDFIKSQKLQPKMNIKRILSLLGAITLLATTGCIYSDGRRHGYVHEHDHFEHHSEVIVEHPAVVVRAPEVVVRPPEIIVR